MTFSAAVRWGNRLNIWKTIPVSARIRASSRSGAHAPAREVPVADLLAVDPDRAAIVGLEEVDAAQERGLAAAGRADDRHHLAALDVEVDAAQHRRRAEGFLDVRQAAAGVRPAGEAGVGHPVHHSRI